MATVDHPTEKTILPNTSSACKFTLLAKGKCVKSLQIVCLSLRF